MPTPSYQVFRGCYAANRIEFRDGDWHRPHPDLWYWAPSEFRTLLLDNGYVHFDDALFAAMAWSNREHEFRTLQDAFEVDVSDEEYGQDFDRR